MCTHLGEFEPVYKPTQRGFDRQYGHIFGALDYFTHIRDGKPDWYRDDIPIVEEGCCSAPPTHSYEHQVALVNASISAIACLADGRVICGGENGSVDLCALTNAHSLFSSLDALATRSAILTGDGQTILMGTANGYSIAGAKSITSSSGKRSTHSTQTLQSNGPQF